MNHSSQASSQQQKTSGTMQGNAFWHTLVRSFAENADILEPPLLYTHIDLLRAALLQQGVDLERPREHLTAEEMTPINKVLHAVEVELVECDPGMELARTCYTGHQSTSDETLVNAGFLFCWLLSTNLDIRSIDVDGTILFIRLPSVLKIGLPLNTTVRKVKVGHWSDETETHGACLAEGIHCRLPLEVYSSHGLELTDESANRVAEVLKSCNTTLEEVSIGSGPQPSLSQYNIKVLLEVLTECCKLSTLNLASCDIGVEVGKCLAKIVRSSCTLKKLTMHQIGDKAFDVIMDGLRANTSLEFLEIGDNCNSSGGIAHSVADFMKHNGSIKKLCLRCLNANNSGAKALASMLSENRTLREFNFEGYVVDDESASAFADCIRQNNTLEKLVLSVNQFDSNTQGALMKALQENKSIRHFCIPWCAHPFPEVIPRMKYRLDNNGLQDLAQALENGAHIIDLNLNWECGFSALYVGQLFSAIGSNDSVTHLHTDSAGYIDAYSARQLSYAFSSTASLKSVSFAYEFDDPNVVMALCTGLSHNRSIREINFGCAFLCDPLPEVLKKLFIANSTLRSFHIYDSCLYNKKMAPILEGLAENYTLTSLRLGSLRDPGDELFQAQELVRRNQRLLRHAVKFVLGKLQNGEAQQAYCKLSSAVSLVEEVMELQSLSQDEAKELVQRAGRFA